MVGAIMNTHKQNIAWIESAPDCWPDGWEFFPGCPMPPGMSKRDYPSVVLAAGSSGGDVPLVEVYTLDRYTEDTDELLGNVLEARCRDSEGRPVRCRVTREVGLPFSESLFLKVREYEPGKFGILENIEIDRTRAHGDVTMCLRVWDSQPALDVEVTV
jgi:hypothetical protein